MCLEIGVHFSSLILVTQLDVN